MKQLPLAEPIINYVPLIDNLLIVAGNTKVYAYPWILESYIELVASLEYEFFTFMCCHLHMWHCPIVHASRVHRDIVELNKENFTENLKLYIDNNFYLTLVVDTYHIEGYSTYQNYHKTHEIFLYGYEKNNFYARDYFDFVKPSCRKINKNDLKKAYFSSPKDYLRGIILYKNEFARGFRSRYIDAFDEKDVIKYNVFSDTIYSNYIIDLTTLIKGLEMFIYKDDTTLAIPNYFRYEYGYRTGFAAINIVFEDTINKINNGEEINKKRFHLIYYHVYLMQERAKYIKTMCKTDLLTEIINELEELTASTLKIRNMAIKFSYDKKSGTKLTETLSEFKSRYYSAILNFIKELKRLAYLKST